MHITFDNSYARLPARFHAAQSPAQVAAPRLIKLNTVLAAQLGIDVTALSDDEAAAIFSGNTVPAGAAPLASAYAGHQFGHFTPQLGDGRAVLLGEVIGRDGIRRDIQLKGAGRTAFSRGGDGRAALGPVLREYIVSEAMAALGIPTTRALAAVATGEVVIRETVQPGAVLTRVAASHIRVGTFQYFAARDDQDAVRLLADHVIARHYPAAATAEQPYAALLAAVIARQAHLVARWLLVGFIHGVMNTDNCSVAGETIDYGPCAFMDAYDPETVFSSIDRDGRYAYGNQPRIAQWNLARLAETLLPLLSDDEEAALVIAHAALGGFGAIFQAAYLDGMRRKIGLTTAHDDDAVLVQDFLQMMAESHADFTVTFRTLCDAVDDDAAMHALFADPTAWDSWATRWRARLVEQGRLAGQGAAATMRAANPAFIPRNHMIEEAIQAAVARQDFAPFEALLTVLAHPFDDQPDFPRHALPPRLDEIVQQTFCGT